ncbi:HD-GYP domain-containing protein [Maribrevibacterium harenarium]|uniref:HD-GYP domain-containing protein n=1 Tax=Maribrevibacterium harenarium TaxID=2589817 RepID=A0A501WP54_9GAMM|nr:HD-GYP domain-containing protein [Maribrevibacterium harenarium]TPE47516.1 HD-GYP domain-containing protein [Maribrevibacterium harenarium]
MPTTDLNVHIPLSELMLSLTTALDMTEGQPPEHCIRCCWIGMNIGQRLGLDEKQRYDLFFTLLLKDAGCSSNAARICELYLTDDQEFKKNFKTVGTSLSSVLNFVIRNTGTGTSWLKRISTTIDILKNGGDYAQELIETRCSRGADVARELRFSEDVADGIASLDEHWDGEGRPLQLSGQEIPLYSRIALLAQVVDVFQQEEGFAAALAEVQSRSGTWFDPELVSILTQLMSDPSFVATINSSDIRKQVLTLAPAQTQVLLDDDYFDCIVAAFGKIVDAKSPYTSGHSQRVGVYAGLIAQELGLDENEIKWVERAALLHDVGKLGVSNSILDKPGKLDAVEWQAVQAHASFTETILEQITPLKPLARIAASHHEKLDGTGYPRGLPAEEIPLITRIITTADIFDAISAERPYRGAMPISKTLAIMEENLHTAIDERCFRALQKALDKIPKDWFIEE